MKEEGMKTLEGAEYSIYLDKKCTKPLKYKDSGEEVKIVTDGSGIYEVNKIPVGRYYVKETKAPNYVFGDDKIPYTMSKEPIEIEVTEGKAGSTRLYRALVDYSPREEFLHKTDIFTGENVPNCLFEIREKDTDKLVFRAKTDKEGNIDIPLDVFEKDVEYTYQELEAPGVYYKNGQLYELNTEKHTFKVEYEVDEKGEFHFKNKIHVENYRPTSTVELQKKDFADSTVIPNCKFELRSLETDFVVEGVTDENGEYVFKDIPYGKYTYTELEAPDEYMIDPEPHEIVIDSEHTRIEVTNEKKPDTGDIAVITLAIMAIVSVAGIGYVVLKNRKRVNN